MNRKLRNFLCVITGGHRMYALTPRATAVGCFCSRCGHEAVMDLSDVKPPRRTYQGVPERHRLATTWQHFRGL
jgi:hypothetical protein